MFLKRFEKSAAEEKDEDKQDSEGGLGQALVNLLLRPARLGAVGPSLP